MWVKICGITRYEDARLASGLGADAVGFVLTPSPRMADPSRLRSWVHLIEGVEKVGVFRDENPGLIAAIARDLGLDTVQIHAPFTEAHALLAQTLRVIVAVSRIDTRHVPAFPCRFLLDASQGRGIPTQVPVPLEIPCILAGGLTPENVRSSIARARPGGVDVSSGVELGPGIKDADKMKKFIKEARA